MSPTRMVRVEEVHLILTEARRNIPPLIAVMLMKISTRLLDGSVSATFGILDV